MNTDIQKERNSAACLTYTHSWQNLQQPEVTWRAKQCMLEIAIDFDRVIELHGVLIYQLTTENFIDWIPSGCCCSR